ncbi:hypothetical protein GH714_041575 [Hevea brasiliensis]|uniref:FACT complex subunit SSRP1 n=1 Tax=Hevea brasiliensis TaxID=3981 RepID=A0A6A6MSP5_HEVBR|nr:hypothetical protein GH714_041575 [Hevea brasiliensis]
MLKKMNQWAKLPSAASSQLVSLSDQEDSDSENLTLSQMESTMKKVRLEHVVYGVQNPGQLKLHSGGILWKKQGGGKAVEVDKADVTKVTWMKVPRTNQLGVRIKDGLYYKFTGFRDQDLANLNNFFQSNCGVTPEEKQLSVSGRNWGEVDLNGNMLTFLVGSKQAFELSLADVSQTQLQGKNDVILEFHVDDTTGANEGRYNVELHLSFLRLQGQANDFKIQYSSVVRLFLLPKSNQPHTFVVVMLDPPIRKGQTLYPHIVLQFDTDNVVQNALSINEDLLSTKYKDKLEPSYKGLIHDVFTAVLRGLSGAKVTKPGKFRSCQDGYAVKSSLKAEDGLLYPLEKSFFFLPKPPTLILHEEIDYVEFERHAAGGSNMHYFDLLIRLKTEQEHLFRNIQRNEYHNLFDFISGKGLKIMNLGDMQTTNGVAAVLQNEDDDAVDPHLERIKNEAGDESDEEDEDFVADKDDEGSPTDDSGEEESDASESGDEKKNVKKSNPGIAFGEVGKVLGDRWKQLSAEEKEPYEAKARADKKRYKDEVSGYRNPQPVNVDSGNESDSA